MRVSVCRKSCPLPTCNAANQLLTFDSQSSSYDAVGNRIGVGGTFASTGLPQPVAATYDAANRQLTFGGATLTYDLNGNLTSDGVTTYTWNARNQLTAMSGPGLSASFVYDGLGRRLRKTINGTATDLLYDGLTPVQESSGTTILATMLTGLRIDESFTRTDAAGTRALLTDALGSTLALADSAGAIQTAYTYEPFGATTVTGPLSSNPFQFTGRENDGTGLYYYRARYYSPSLQRFIGEDPYLHSTYGQCPAAGVAAAPTPLASVALKDPQILNMYGYVANNPIKYFDPFGLDKKQPCQGAGGCPCGQHLQTDWECVTFLGLATATTTGVPLALVGIGALTRLGPVLGPVGFVGTAAIAAGLGYYFVWLPCQRCVPD